MRAFFVAGTDTGIGKTIVSASIAAYLSVRKGMDVGVMKPFETGVGEGISDSELLRQFSQTSDDLSLISPYRFALPLSPYAASILESRTIDLDFLDGVFQRLKCSHLVTLVEGAGGILVPIRKGFFLADLIKRWDLPTIVVAPLGLGTINHTLLTLHHLSCMNIEVIGLILNDKDSLKDVSKDSNPRVIAEHTDVPILGIFPYLKETPGRERLADIAEQFLDFQPILSRIP